MINELLGSWNPAPAIPVILILLIMGLIYIGIPVLIITLIIKMFKYFKEAAKERKLLRIELGKLADEVQQLRKLRPDNQNSS